MRILTTLTYYRPHTSGLTIYAERLARALVQRGHQVTVLTSQYDKTLPPREDCDGVRVLRVPVLMHVSKGVLMPTLFYWAWVNARHADVVHLHLPQFDSAYIALISRLLKKPVVLTYHCDLLLPGGFINLVANQVAHLANKVAMGLADQIIVNTMDYAESSAVLKPYLQKIQALPTPVELQEATACDVEALRRKARVEPGQHIIGITARLAAEKGVEYLVEAMPEVLKKHPTARVLHVGQYKNVMGEEGYANKLKPMIEALGDRWTFLGLVPPGELRAFYQLCELTVLPSINSTESFGIVQVESMACGTPVIASDMPGVRQPVRITGMGKVVPPMDANQLALAINEVLDNPGRYQGDAASVARNFSPQYVAQEYEQVFQEVIRRG